jgi:hypothetical protein
VEEECCNVLLSTDGKDVVKVKEKSLGKFKEMKRFKNARNVVYRNCFHTSGLLSLLSRNAWAYYA